MTVRTILSQEEVKDYGSLGGISDECSVEAGRTIETMQPKPYHERQDIEGEQKYCEEKEEGHPAGDVHLNVLQLIDRCLLTRDRVTRQQEEERQFASKQQPRDKFIVMILGICFATSLLVLIASLVFFYLQNLNSHSASTTSSCQHLGNGNRETFDYIVIGGGPSGIITASMVARAFEFDQTNPVRVLLLESGQSSQSSVLESLEGQSGSHPVVTSTKDIHFQEGKSKMNLNKFDIPLMWSGIASGQHRRRSVLTPNGGFEEIVEWSDYHWPMKQIILPRALGGSGIQNAMINVRCLPTDLEQWNLTGWSYDSILGHYKNLETFMEPKGYPGIPMGALSSLDQEKDSRGYTGPVTTILAGSKMDVVTPLFLESSISSGIGLAKVQGFNAADPSSRIGAGLYEFNIRDGVRDSIAAALLGRKRHIIRDINNDDNDDQQATSIPKNLIIQTGVTVTRVLTKQATGSDHGKQTKPRAVGVEYTSMDGQKGTFLLKNMSATTKMPQVILAAGALLTPQILFNSGIGENGTIVHLPGVGKNLHDHPVVPMSFQLDPNILQHSSSVYTVGQELEDYLNAVSELQNFEVNVPSSDGEHNKYDPMELDNLRNSTKLMRQIVQERIGTFGTPGFSAGAFLRSPWAIDDAPDIQLTVFPRVMEPHVTGKNEKAGSLRYDEMLITVALLHPEARYEVQAATSKKTRSTTGIEPATEGSLVEDLNFRLPSIELPPNTNEYLTPRDVKILAWGMEQVRRVTGSSPMKDSILHETSPGLDIDLEEFVRKNHLPNSHWVGSTKMGSKNDPFAVLDEELRVRGIDGLRVVDAGAIPMIPNGNTHSTVCVVASRAAEMMIAERRQSPKS